jgi:hypothetical protein
MIFKTLLLFSLLFVVTANALVNAQSRNLLQNPDATKGEQSWRAYGDAVIETTATYSCFVVRHGGHFYQDVELPKEAAGQYLVFIGRGAGERITAKDGATGFSAPYLYGYMMQPPPPGGKEILEYLQVGLFISTIESLQAPLERSASARCPNRVVKTPPPECRPRQLPEVLRPIEDRSEVPG